MWQNEQAVGSNNTSTRFGNNYSNLRIMRIICPHTAVDQTKSPYKAVVSCLFFLL